MKIQKFNEAYKYGYRGKGKKSDRKDVINELVDIFTDQNLLGFEIISTTFSPNKEELYLHLYDVKVDANEYCIKLDLSGMGIEIGKMEWNEDEENYEDFVPEINLNNDKSIIASNIKNFNL